MPVSSQDRSQLEDEFSGHVQRLKIELVLGGEERTESVSNGLEVLAGDDQIELVAVHDAARPLVSDADLRAVFANAWQTSAAILASPISGTIKRAIGTSDCETVDRRDLWTALTPQVFAPGLLRYAYQRHRGRPATDDAELVERIGHDVFLVKGSSDNIKITHPDDLLLAEAILTRQNDHAQ
jgi:2-C-methyl-D-erythritol 4-phosphate cytidylyltransferase